MDTVLHQAVEAGNLRTCQYLTRGKGKEAFINQPGDAVWTALHVAVEDGHLEIAARLLRKGADPNLKADKYGLTPLILAVFSGNLEMCQLLLRHGADINLPDNQGGTALACAKGLKHTEIVTWLKTEGAK